MWRGMNTSRSRLAEAKNLRLCCIPADTFAAPTVTSCTPSSVAIAGGTSVSVAGAGFLDGVGAVYFGGVAATDVAVVSDVLLTCTAPAHSAGAVTIHIRGPGGFGRLANGATYA